MKIFKLPLFLCLFYCLGFQAQIKLPKLISDNIILQRDQAIKIWGWASPNEKIVVLFNKKSFKTNTSNEGKWEILLPAHAAGTGYQMVLKGFNLGDSITIKSVIVNPSDKSYKEYPKKSRNFALSNNKSE